MEWSIKEVHNSKDVDWWKVIIVFLMNPRFEFAVTYNTNAEIYFGVSMGDENKIELLWFMILYHYSDKLSQGSLIRYLIQICNSFEIEHFKYEV